MQFYLLFVKILTVILAAVAFILYFVFAFLPLSVVEYPMGVDITGVPKLTRDQSVFKDKTYQRFVGPLLYTVNFCSTEGKPAPVRADGQFHPEDPAVQDLGMCAYAKATMDRYAYQALDMRYDQKIISDGLYYRSYYYTSTELATYKNPTGDTKAYYDMLVGVAAKQVAAFILAILAVVGSFAVMAGSVYTRIICNSKIFLVVTAVVSAGLGIASAALSTSAYPKGTFTNTQTVCRDKQLCDPMVYGDTITMSYDFKDAFALSNGAATVIVAIVVSFLSLVPPLFAKDKSSA